MRFNPYSFSKINTHKTCPRKFKLHYIDKIKTPHVYNEALVKGGAVHSILEYFPLKSPHKLAEKYFDVVEPYLKTEEGWDLIHKNALKEYEIGLTQDFIECSYNDKQAMFRGSVDRVIIDDIITLVDFKTGKYKPDIDVENGILYGQEYDQLLFYSIWFFIKFPHIDVIKISFVYVEHNKINSKMLYRSELNDYKFNLVQYIFNIEKDIQFNKKEGPLCNYCDYQVICEVT